MTKTKKRSLLLISVLAMMAFALVSFLTVKPVSAETTPVVAIEQTAQITYSGEKSIRFSGSVANSVELSAPAEDGSYLATDTYAGMIIAKGKLDASALTAETKDVINLPATVYADGETAKTFHAVIEDVAIEDYAQDYTARAYVYQNGAYTYTADVVTRSLAEVASKVFAEEFNNLLVEEQKELRNIVDAIDVVVKVGDTVLDDSIDNVIEITAGDEKAITVSPSNVTLFINGEKDNRVTTVADSAIKVKGYSGNSEYAYIDVGNKVYIVSIKTKPYYDADLEGTNYLATFDKEKALLSIQDGTTDGSGVNNSITWIDKDSEEGQSIGATSGVIKVDAQAWDVAQFNVQFPLKVSEVGGVYVRFKMPVELEWDANDTDNGIMYASVNNISSRALANTMFRTYKSGNGDWHYLAISTYDLIKTFGLSYDDTISSLYLMPVYKGCVYYIDEIGVYRETKTGNTQMISSFDGGAEQNALVFDRFSYKWFTVQPGETSYPTSINGASTGLLRISPVSGHGCPTHIHVAQPVPTKNLSKIKIRVYVPKNTAYNSTTLQLHINFNEKFDNYNANEFDLRFGVVRGQWNEVELAVPATITSEYIRDMNIYKRLWDDSTEMFNNETNWYLDYVQAIYNA